MKYYVLVNDSAEEIPFYLLSGRVLKELNTQVKQTYPILEKYDLKTSLNLKCPDRSSIFAPSTSLDEKRHGPFQYTGKSEERSIGAVNEELKKLGFHLESFNSDEEALRFWYAGDLKK